MISNAPANNAAAGTATFANGRKHAQPTAHYDLYAAHPELLEATDEEKVAAYDAFVDDLINKNFAYEQMLRRIGVYVVGTSLADRAQAISDLARGTTVQAKRFVNGLTGTGNRPSRPRRPQVAQVEPEADELEDLPARGSSQVEDQLQRLIELNEAILEALGGSTAAE